MIEHRIVAMSLSTADGCAQCERAVLDAWSPHNVTVRCTCGQFSCGIRPHTWTIKTEGIWTPGARGILGTLSPSYAWLNNPRNPSQGEHRE